MAFAREETLRYAEVRERNIIRNVYLWMTAGLALTGVVAMAVSSSRSMIATLVGNPVLFFALIIGELVLVSVLSARINKMSASSATLAFAGYAVLNGITLSIVFLAYTGQTIALAFFYNGGDLRRDEPLGVDDKARSFRPWSLPDDGALGGSDCDSYQFLSQEPYGLLYDQLHRYCGFSWSYGL